MRARLFTQLGRHVRVSGSRKATPSMNHGCSPSAIYPYSVGNLACSTIVHPHLPLSLRRMSQPLPQPIAGPPHNGDPSAWASYRNSFSAATQTAGIREEKRKSDHSSIPVKKKKACPRVLISRICLLMAASQGLPLKQGVQYRAAATSGADSGRMFRISGFSLGSYLCILL